MLEVRLGDTQFAGFVYQASTIFIQPIFTLSGTMARGGSRPGPSDNMQGPGTDDFSFIFGYNEFSQTLADGIQRPR